jgi:predicted amidohydrolase
MQKKINCCLIQSDICPDKVEDNLEHYNVLLKNIENQPDILVFPEMFACGFSENIAQIAANYTEICLVFLYQTAQEHNADVVASLPIMENGQLFNRLVWVRENQIIAQYDKKHLFFGCEKTLCTSGKTKTIVNKNGWNFLPLICYDIRFPIWCRNHYKNDAFLYDCLLLIANFPAPRVDTLKSLLVARAIENQAYVIGVNRIGEDGIGNKHCGNSIVISPLGEIITEAPRNKEFLLSVNLERTMLDKFRDDFPVYKDWDL